MAEGPATEIDFEQFLAVDMRVGRVTVVEDFPEARKPAWKLTIDFGPEIGEKRSSAQIKNYSQEELEGRLVVGVVNFPPRQIGPFRSEVLVLGALDDEKGVILLQPDGEVAVGDRIAEVARFFRLPGGLVVSSGQKGHSSKWLQRLS